MPPAPFAPAPVPGQFGQVPPQPQYGQMAGPQSGYYTAPGYVMTPMVYADSGPKGLSITSMVLGIVGFIASIFGVGVLLIPQILAVIFGHIALKKEPGGRGMAITGLVLGYIGLAIGLVLLAILIIVAVIGAAAISTYR